MSDRQARKIVKIIRNGNEEASIALLKTFGLVKLIKPKLPVYYWLKPEER
jgi:hypothetical protein